MKKVRFELARKDPSLSLRLPAALLATLKANAAKANMPTQRLFRMMIEAQLGQAKTEGPAKDRSAETDREASGLREASLSFPRTRESSSPPPVRGYDRGSEGPHRSPPPSRSRDNSACASPLLAPVRTRRFAGTRAPFHMHIDQPIVSQEGADMGVKLVVAVTDGDWFDHLRAAPHLTEVNFWSPSDRSFRALEPGELFLFKLHAPRNFIVGGGWFAHATILPCSLAWEAFGEENGAATLREMRARIAATRSDRRKTARTSTSAAEFSLSPSFCQNAPGFQWATFGHGMSCRSRPTPLTSQTGCCCGTRRLTQSERRLSPGSPSPSLGTASRRSCAPASARGRSGFCH